MSDYGFITGKIHDSYFNTVDEIKITIGDTETIVNNGSFNIKIKCGWYPCVKFEHGNKIKKSLPITIKSGDIVDFTFD